MIYVLHGDDSFSAAEALRELIEAVGPPDARDSNVTTIEAGAFSVEKLGAAAMVVPFLADRRAVVARGWMGTAEAGQRRGRRGQDNAQTKPPPGLGALLAELPPTSDVVFFEGKLSAANPLLKAVAAAGGDQVRTREFPLLRGPQLAAWIAERAEKKAAAIDRRAVALLADQVGANLWAMDSELEKLAIYCGDRPIGEEDVRALVTSAKESNVFDLVDAIMERRPDAALSTMQRLLDEGKTGLNLVALITGQARRIALAQELAARNAPREEWGARLGTASDFAVGKAAEQARRFSRDAVAGLYRLLLQTDLALKSGSSDELALTEMVARAGTLPIAPRRGR